MPRTPLLRVLSQIAQDHRDADRLGITPEEALERRISRRDFLRKSGAVGAAAAAGPLLLARPARAATNMRIAIVGGGISGLNAALTLNGSGVPCTLFESSSRLGGRMHSDSPLVYGGDNYFSGQTAEYCGELIDTGHKTILHLAQQFGLATVDMIQAEPNGTTEIYYFHGGYYSYAQASNDFKPVHQTIQNQVNKAGYPTNYNTSNATGQQLDNTSLYNWIEQYVPGGHASNLGALIDSAYNQEFGAETTDQSSLNLLFEIAYQPSPGNLSIYGASDQRYHILGGNQQLPEAIASYVQGTGLTTIVKNTRMNTIAKNSDGTVSLWFDGSSTPQVFDQVILAFSFSVLRGLDYSKAGFDPLKQTAITQLGSGRNAKLNLQYDTRYWNQSGPWGAGNGDTYTDVGFQNSWDVTRGQAGSTGIMVFYTGGNVAGSFNPSTPYSNAATNPQVTTYAKQYLKQLEVVYPGITPHWNGKAMLSVPFQDPNLLCSYAYWRVGQYTKFAGYESMVQGPIHFAGEQCSYNFQGFMEGGAQAGASAANEILALLK